MSGRSVNLTALFLGRLRPPKRLTGTSCTHFRQQLKTALLEKAEGGTKVCCQTGYRTQDPTYESGAGPHSAIGRAPDSLVRGPGFDTGESMCMKY